MDFDLGSVLPIAPAANDAEELPEIARLVCVMTQMQEGIDMLTQILTEHAARIGTLEVEVRRLKARTDAPVRSAILRPH